MRKYLDNRMRELSAELAAGLVRLRKGHVDAAEQLIRIIDPRESYPYEFVVFRLTGYRPPRSRGGLMPGKTLRRDLMQLMLDVCDSFELRCGDYNEPIYDIPALARHFSVSTKTVQRWRGYGLPARRLVYDDGKRRIAFLAGTVRWFAQSRQRLIARSERFTQMTDSQRVDIIRRARRMAAFTRCSLNEVAHRIGRRTGRAVETVRYTIRRHDLEQPDHAVFPHMTPPLADREKSAIYMGFLRGAAVSQLARQYRRTRGSIYRIIHETRARQLLSRPISYVYSPEFDLPNAEELILDHLPPIGAERTIERRKARAHKPPDDLPPYLRALYDVPLLAPIVERRLFACYNYLKYAADKLRQRIDLNRVRSGDIKRIEALLVQANVVKNRIIRANLRLVVSIAKRHLGGPQGLFELISDGNVSLMRAVEKFDYTRGNRFSTYASWAIMRNFARSVPKERYLLDRFSTGQDEVLDIAASLQAYEQDDMRLGELRESIDVVLAHLSPLERSILVDHYGLHEASHTKTLDQLGRRLGVSKERVRQIELQALRKLRKILRPQQADLMS